MNKLTTYIGLALLLFLPMVKPAIAENQSQMGQTPQEMGKKNYFQLVAQAKESVSRLPPNTKLTFPLAVNYPIRLWGAKAKADFKSSYRAIGYITLSGEAKPLTAEELLKMFDYHLDAYYESNLFKPTGVLIADAAGGGNLPSQQDHVVNLLVLDTQTNEVKLAPNIIFNGILNDALNATLSNTLTATNIDVSKLDLKQVQHLLPKNPIRSPL